MRRTGVNLAIWERRLPDLAVEGFADPAYEAFAPVRFDSAPDRVASEIGRMLPGGPAAAWLAADVADLAAAFADLARVKQVSVRLEAVAGDSCRLFHADNVSLRLVTTYRGRGTQWVTDEDARDIRPGNPPRDACVRDVETGHVAVFKGAKSAGDGVHALVHRSPPRRPGDDVRLFLAIDPAVGAA